MGRVVTIYTDGSCRGNPGPGGWGVLLTDGRHERTEFGSSAHTTSNRMELTAAIKALGMLKTRCEVVLYSDSSYVVNGASKWMSGWKRKGWRRGKKPVANLDLWLELDVLAQQHSVRWVWVKGHSGVPGNEIVDRLAARGSKAAAERQAQ